ncbi:DUF4352 domain-containing protein [Candidatus Woesearchaeota archaeon]|nr:DUF4352 domain-containing protein [Candidatus Woesearchaeota archaeon]
MATEKKAWYKRWWAIVLFVIIGFIILTNLFGGNDSSITIQPSSNTAEKAPENAQTYSIDDSIPTGDFTWKITGVSTTSAIGQELAGTFFGEKADGIFVILDVEVENTAKTAKYLTDSYIKLVDSQNREFSPNSVAAVYLKPEGSALLFGQLNPGITKKGKIVYDVPENVKTFDVKITSSAFSSKMYYVKVEI